MKLIVTTDFPLSSERCAELVKDVAEWVASPKPVAVLGDGVHVAAQQPDGTWARVCHHDPPDGVTR